MRTRCRCSATLTRDDDSTALKCSNCGRTYLPHLSYRMQPVQCPICEWSGDTFAPGGRSAIPNFTCPQCKARPWHRALFLYYQLETNLVTENLRVLHFAPEKSLRRFLRSLPNLTYVSTDLAQEKIDVKANMCHLPFRGQSFDVLLANHVLEHIEDDNAALREIHRVLSPSGSAILTFPYRHERATLEDPSITSREDRLAHYRQENHFRLPGNDYHERIARSGFGVEVVPYFANFDERTRHRFGLRETYIFNCTKVGL